MAVSAVDLSRLKVKELKLFLRERGESVAGSKPELLARAKGSILLKNVPLGEIVSNDQNCDNQRSIDKLTSPLGEKLPNPESLTLWNKDVTLIPNVTNDTLYNFLVLNKCRTFDAKQTNAKRQLKAKVFYEDRHEHSVLYNEISDSCSHCFVKYQVLPSLPTDTAVKKPDYGVWVCLSKVTGRIHSASCTCTAGKGEACNHISALLYALVDITRRKNDGTLSVTSEQCKRNQPRKRKLTPKKSQDLLFTKHTLKSTNKENIPKRSTEKPTSNINQVNINNFKEKLTKCNPHAAWLSSFIPTSSKNCQEDKSLPSLQNISHQCHDNVDLKDPDTVQSFVDYFCSLSITPEDCQTIKETTKGQHNNNNWVQARKGRITSSQFGSVCKRLSTTSPDNLLKTIFYPVAFKNEATKWGIQRTS